MQTMPCVCFGAIGHKRVFAIMFSFSELLCDRFAWFGVSATGQASPVDATTLVLAMHLDSLQGCTEPRALNYAPGKTTDDGSCRYICNMTACAAGWSHTACLRKKRV